MAKKQSYSIEELAKASKMPASTARYYIEAYTEFFDFSRPSGVKYRVFDESCIDVLKDIRKAQKDGLKKHEILKLLAEKYTTIIEQETETPANQQLNSQQITNDKKTSQMSLSEVNKKQIINTREHIETLVEFNSQQIELTKRYQGQSNHKSAIIKELDEVIENKRKKIKELQEKLYDKDKKITQLTEQLETLEVEHQKLKKKKRIFF